MNCFFFLKPDSNDSTARHCLYSSFSSDINPRLTDRADASWTSVPLRYFAREAKKAWSSPIFALTFLAYAPMVEYSAPNPSVAVRVHFD